MDSIRTFLLTRPQVEVITGLRRSSLYREMRRGKFPSPVRISTRAVRWRMDEVQAWIDSRPRATGDTLQKAGE